MVIIWLDLGAFRKFWQQFGHSKRSETPHACTSAFPEHATVDSFEEEGMHAAPIDCSGTGHQELVIRNSHEDKHDMCAHLLLIPKLPLEISRESHYLVCKLHFLRDLVMARDLLRNFGFGQWMCVHINFHGSGCCHYAHVCINSWMGSSLQRPVASSFGVVQPKNNVYQYHTKINVAPTLILLNFADHYSSTPISHEWLDGCGLHVVNVCNLELGLLLLGNALISKVRQE